MIDASQVAQFSAGFDTAQPDKFVNVLAQRNTDGSFTFTRSQLETIYGGTLPDGSHTLHLQAQDQYGNISSVFNVAFTLDTSTAAPTLNLAANSDSGSSNSDRITNITTPTITGNAEPGVTVQLLSDGQAVSQTTSTANGTWQIATSKLTDGTHSLSAIATDIAGNVNTDSTPIQVVIDTKAPQLNLTNPLQNATLTPNAQLSGSVDGTGSAITSLSYHFDNLAEVPVSLNTDGTFNQQFNFTGVSTGSHTLTITTTDLAGNTTTSSLNVVVPNQAPIFTSQPGINASANTLYTYNITTTDPDGHTPKITAKTTLPSWLTLRDNGDGTAKLSGTPGFVQSGIYNITLTATDPVFNVSTDQTLQITVDSTLIEEKYFSPNSPVSLTIGQNPSILNFKIDPLTFDLSDPSSIKDAFEVSLIDAAGHSLVPTIGTGRDSFFNWTEKQSSPTLAAGASYNATSQMVSLNLSGITAGTLATLTFRLVNNDSDTKTQVSIKDFSITDAPSGTQPPSQTNFLYSTSTTPTSIVDESHLTDVSPSFKAEYQRTSFNLETNLLYADIAVRNIGQYSVDAPLLVAVTHISDPTVVLSRPDGFTPDGTPYYNFTNLVANGKLDPNGLTGSRSLVFSDPNKVQFTYDLQVLSELNFAPVIQTKPEVQVIGGKTYSYNINATDPNGDTLIYKLLVAPNGMTINPTTGYVTWSTATTDIGNQAVDIQVNDGHGGITEQKYTLAVLSNTTPNRPPNFVTDPVVDAAVNQPYVYNPRAVDPDLDPLTYNLIIGPDGLTVDPNTGQVRWTPQPVSTLGDTVLAQISTPGEVDKYNFSAVAGQRMYFDKLKFNGNTYDWKIQVLSPSHRLIVDSDAGFTGPFNITENGNYQVVVKKNGDLTGDYSFSLVDLDQTTAINFDQNISDSLNPGTKDKVYHFSGTAGQRLYFNSISSNTNLDWVLYGGDNQVIWQSGWSDVETVLPSDGPYVLALRGKAAFSDRVPYTFQIVDAQTVNRTLSLGNNTTPNTVNGNIVLKGEQDTYTFTGTAGQQLYFDVIKDGGYDTDTATLKSPSGITYFNRYLTKGDSFPFTLNENGTYELVIDGVGGNTGAYSFSMLDVGQATPISLDTDVSGTLTPGSSTQLYQFNGSAGQHLYMNSLLGAAGYWYIDDSGNNRVAGNGLGNDFELTLSQTDTYTLVVQGGGSQGTDSNSPINYKFHIFADNTPNTPLSLGTNATPNVVSDSIVKKGDVNTYTFTGTAGQQLYFDVIKDGGDDTDTATLKSPSGITYFNRYLTKGDAFPFTLNENGTYELVIDGVGGSTGAYSFSMLDVGQATPISLDTDISGTLTPGSSTQLYQFNGSAGQHLYMNSLLGAAGYWYIDDSGNNRVAGNGLGNDFELTLSQTDTYTLVVQGGGSQGADSNSPINYKFRVITDNTPNTPLSLGTNATPNVVSDSIVKKGDVNTYTFTGTAGQQLYFDVIKDGGYDTDTATLKSPSGITYFNRYLTAGDAFPFTLNENGTYELVIDGAGGNTGAYSFSMLDVGQATPISLDTDVSGTLTPGSSTKLYQFNGSVGQHLYMNSLLSATGNWYIYDSGNHRVASNSLNYDFELTLSKTDTYTLVVQGGGSQGTDSNSPINYKFRVITSSTPVTPLSLGSNATPNVVSDSIIKKGDVNTYTFTGTAGEQLYFDTINSIPNATEVTLNSPSGIKLFDRKVSDGDYGIFTLLESGNYSLVVDGVNASTDSYSFRIADGKAATPVTLFTASASSLPAFEVQLYRIDGTQGQNLQFNNLTSVSNADWVLYNPAGNVFASSSLNNVGVGFETALPTTGAYLLAVRNFTGSAVNFNVQVNDISPASVTNTGFGKIYTGTSTATPTNQTFTANAGTLVYFDTQVANNYSSGMSTQLLDPAGVRVFNTNTTYDTGIFILPKTGSYTLQTVGNGNYNYQMIDLGSATNLALNENATAALGAYQTTAYKFTGTVDQQLFYDGLSANSGVSWKLISPSGQTVVDSNDAGSDRGSDNGLTLPSAGTYYLLFSNGSAGTTTASFRLLDKATATPYTLDTTVSGTFTGRESYTYRFNGTQGQYIYIDQQAGGYYNNWNLYGPGGQYITSNHIFGDFELALPSTGDYFLVESGNGAGDPNYKFRITKPTFPTTAYTLGSTVNGTISKPGEKDTYTFTGTFNQELFFDGLNTNDPGLTVRLIAPSGVEVKNNRLNQDIGPNDGYTLFEAGTYKLVIDGDGANTGDYSFRLLDKAAATLYTLDTTVSGTFTARESYTYRFSGTQGQYIYIDQQAGNYHNNWNLYGPGGQYITSNDIYADRELALPSTGDYFLVESSYGAGDPNYKFRITTPTFPTTAYTLGSTVNGTISKSGENDTYTFTGTFNQELFFDGLNTNDPGLTVRLIAPSGVEVKNNRLNQDIGPNDGYTLFEAGTYKLVIDGDGANTGDYSFRLLDKAAATLYTLDTTVSGTFTAKESYTYRFSGTQGQYIYIDQQAGNYHNNWNLYGPGGQYITSNDIYADRELALPSTGDYFLVESSYGAGDPNYKFRITTPTFPTTAYTLGSTVNGTISKSGENDTYTFTGTFNQQLFFDGFNTNDPGLTVRLIAPSGVEVKNNRLNQDIGPNDGYTLFEAGTYKLVIDGDGANTGDYSFRLLDKAAATPYTLDTTVSGTFTGRESYTYRFSGTQGQYIYIDQQAGNYYNYWNLYGPGGQYITSNQIYGDLELALPSTGDYFLVESGNGSSDPNYQFRIYAPSLPTTAYTLDSTVSNTLTKKGEYDTYTFNGRSGQRLYFDRLIGNGQMKAKLYSPSNVVVASGDLGNDIAPFFLREDGNYRLVIDGSGETTGDYSFRLVDIDTAPTLSLDTPLAAVLNPGTEADFYQFGGAAGERLYFHLGATSWPQGQADWVLYGPDNQALVVPNYYSPDFSVVLPTAGTYVLGVRGYGATPLNYSFTAYTTPISTTSLTLGSTVAAALSKPGERDEYTFTGAIGQHLFLDALVGSSSIHAKLIAPNGVQLFNNTLDRDGVPIVLTDEGTYRLAIDGDGATTGNYSFRFSDMAGATALSVGTTTNGSLMGNSVNLYSYSGKAGQTLNFNLGSTTWNGANWVLYDASGAVLAAPNASSPNFQVTLAANGVYTLAIVGSSSNPVNYSFTVTDNSAVASTNSGFGALQTLSVNSNQVVDYNFTASAGTILLYDSRDEQNGNNYSLRVRLQNPDGTYAFNGQDERYDTGPIVLTQSGNYKLQVYNADTNRVTNFQLLQLPLNLGPGAHYLEMDNPVSGTLNHAESKVYTFQAVNGLKVLLNGMAGATNYTLYDSSGRQVFAQNDSGGHYWIPPVWADTSLDTLTQNDLYHLVVSNTSGADNNPYSFELLETSNVQEVNYGVPVSDSLADGRLDTIYKIKAGIGDNLFFDSIATNAPNSNYRWKLYDPGNQLLFNNDLHTSTSVTIAETGYYYLEIEGGPDTNQINYQFRVFSYTSTANTIITPGAGGTSSTDPDALGVFSVKLGVKDNKGGNDVQNYQIRVGADPQDHNPVITSNPETRVALADGAYRYSVRDLDADHDKLSYRLVNSPVGALINKDTGELLWFPSSTVTPGSKANFTVEVNDGRGGKDTQTFNVDVYQNLGTIQGAVFNDLNANGVLDSKLISGDNPDIVFAIDVSGSTMAPFHGNGKYNFVKTVLDAEKAAVKATVDAIVAMGGGDKVKISFIPFTNDGTIQDMNPAAHTGLVTYTTALADLDHNGIPDYLQILNSYTSGGSSKFTQVVQKIDTLIKVLPGTPNVIYMSDGYGYLDPTVAKNVAADVKSKGGNLNAFAIGAASTYSTLQKLDANAIQVTDINELTNIFSGFDDRYAREPFIKGVTVYLDQNNNGQLDPGEPYQITQQDNTPNSLDTNSKYYFTFKNLLPGTYTVRTLLPSGYTMTTPTGNVWTDTVTTNGETISNLFGITSATITPPNHDPVFLTTPPAITLLKANLELRYNALALDPDADIVTYDLVTAPAGMTVDPHDGIVVWSPTTAQVDKYYQDLGAEQARLTAIGRGAYAPTDVEFNVLLRATDGKGGQALQYIKVQLVPNNHSPVFTSTLPNNTQPQVGKPFQYQVTAIDPDNDPITFSLINAPTGAVIDAKTGLLTWTPVANQLGNEQFSIQVQDNKGGSNSQPIQLTVVNPHINHPPVFTSTPRTSTRTENPYIYTLQATDQDFDPLTFTLVNAPTGMTLDRGVITWQPTASQFGNNNVSVQVSDGLGGSTTQTWTIQVTNHLSNLPPTITSTPNTVTAVGRTYSYKPTAIDPNGDSLIWSLASDTNQPPQGMVIDSSTGTIVWQPTTTQIGDTTVDLKVTDAYGAYNIQEFTIHVNGINSPPKIVSTPVTSAGIGQNYTYQVLATDPDFDPVTFNQGGKPAGMTITKDGLIQWTPTTDQVGKYDIQVIATDDRGASTSQTYTLLAGTTAVNHPPVITSTPVFVAAVGNTYNYLLTATDADNNTINYKLISGPSGMVIDAKTGLLSWTTPVTGSYQVVVGADDGLDGAAQSFTLNALTITPPVIQSTTPPTTAVPNTQYRYDIIAVDPSGGQLTYSLDRDSINLGMSVDTQGRLSWTPTIAQVGSHAVTLTVTDTAGISSQQNFNLVVAADTTAPHVKLVANYNQVNKGDQVSFQALATDNVQVAGLQLVVNGTPVALDARGIATVTLNQAGTISAVASATDTAGNVGQASTSVLVIDPTDTPVVNLDLSSIANDTITAPTDITGTVTDSNLDYYVLEVARVGSNNFQEVFRGTTTVNNGVLGKFDPSLLGNDTYTLRLEAHGKNGSISTTDDTISVAGNLKLGNFRLSFTDLSVPVTGIPITLTRTYDSLDASATEDFGYGWRMEFRDTDLRTSVGKPSDDLALLGEQNPFKDGTRVYLTLPGGKREGFTFKPVVDQDTARYVGALTSATIYHPSFVADHGVTDTLTVENAVIIHGNGTNEYYGLAGNPYNPADPYYGTIYTLTTKEGVKYQIDAQSGKLLTVTDTNRNKLTYTDADITSSTGQKITFGRDAQGRITSVTDPMGKQIQYQYDGNGDLVAVTDRDGNTTQFVYDTTRVHFLDNVIDPLGRTGVRNQYSDDGRLTQILDAQGKAVNLSYDPSHSTETVKDALGNLTTYEYDERGNVVQEVDALGGVIKRTYDENNHKLTQTDADGVTTTYTYDSNGNPLTITDPQGNATRITYNQYNEVLSITSPKGLTVSSTYDGQGNLLSRTNTDGQTTTFNYDQFGRLIKQTAPDGEVSTYTYDSKGNPIIFTDSRGNQAISTYDLNGKVKTLSMVFPKENQTLTTSYTYDNSGRTTSVTDPQGNISKTEYDAKGNVIATTDIRGNRTQYFYDDKGQQIKVIRPDNTPNNPNDNPTVLTEYDAEGRVISQTSATGLKTSYVYDALGRLTDTILPDLTPNNPFDNPDEKIEYTAAGRVKAKVDIFGTRTEYTYDTLGRVSRERDFFGNSAGNDTTYTYNADGQVTSLTDARNRTTLFGIDDLGRKSQTTYFDGTTSQVTYDTNGRTKSETNQLGQTTSYSYDAFGKVATITNPLNQQTQYTYNSRGSLVKVTDALNHDTQYEYDQYNRQTAVIDANGDRTETTYDQYGQVTATIDATQHTTQYFYDNLGELTLVQLANQATTNYTYDKDGRLTEVEDANHNQTTYSYDAFNRRIATTLPLGQQSTTTYNNLGQIANTSDFNGDVINYSYDQYGRLANKSFSNPLVATVSYTYDPVTSQVKTVTDGRGVTTYGFDSYDRVNLITNPDGQTVGYTYDVLGNLKTRTTSSSTVNYSYDALNRLDTVTSGGQLAKYSYDAVGNLISTALGDGTTETRQYDASNRLKGIKTNDALGAVLSSYAYTLDGVGERTQVVENTGRTVNYTYDEVNQLKQESITDPTLGTRTISYNYDLVGNRLQRNDSDAKSGLTTYTYDKNNRLISQTSGLMVTQYTYDNNGSMLTANDGTNSIVYKWINDGENRLVRVTTTNASESTSSTYIYDDDGHRVASITDGVRTNYLIDPRGNSQVLQEYDANGQVQTKYFYGLGLIESVSGSNQSFYHSDALGSTRLLTDGTGQVTDRYVYDAFGQLIAHAGGSGNAYQFAGEHRDSTGLDLLGVRYYNSDLGRFISKDEFAGSLSSPITQNPYVYANANPVNFTDPSGYESLGDISAAEAIGNILDAIGTVGVRAVAATVGGALAGGVFSAARQGIQLIDGSRTDFSFGEVIEGAEIGAALGPLFAVLPEAAIYFAYQGVNSGIEQIKAGNFATGAFDIVTSIAPLFSKGNEARASNQPDSSEPIVNYLFGGEENQPSFSHSITPEESNTLSQIRNTIIEARGILNNKFRKKFQGENPTGTVGFAVVDVDGYSYTTAGFSGTQDLAPFAPLRPKDSTQLETLVIDYDRYVDAEAKILEQVLVQTDTSSTGTIRLVVDKTACESCAGSAIPHFQRLRPGIKIEIIHPPQGSRL